MRLDRLLSLYFFAPLGAALNSGAKERIPILMYHSISENLSKGIHPYFEVCTTPEVFDKQMRFLHENGYTAISLEDVTGALSNGRTIPPKPVCLTFDDGFRDFLTGAFPILSKYGFSATVFLPTGFIGNERGIFKNRECLTWEEVRGLRAGGVRFGSHSVNHIKLDELTGPRLIVELQESRKRMEDELRENVETFAYPFAFPEENRGFVLKLKQAVLEVGYKLGATTMIGRVSAEDNPLFLKRIPVNAFDDVAFLHAKLEGGYDWLHPFQRFSKFARKPLTWRRLRTDAN